MEKDICNPQIADCKKKRLLRSDRNEQILKDVYIKIPKLKIGAAVPPIFPNCSNYWTKQSEERKNPNTKRLSNRLTLWSELVNIMSAIKTFNKAIEKTACMQCQFSDEVIKSILNKPNTIENCEKQTQTEFSNFIYSCEKCGEKSSSNGLQLMSGFDKKTIDVNQVSKVNKKKKVKNNSEFDSVLDNLKTDDEYEGDTFEFYEDKKLDYKIDVAIEKLFEDELSISQELDEPVKTERSSENKSFVCEICKRKFSTEKLLEEHVEARHNENKEFLCKYCSEKIIGITEYKKHCKVHNAVPTEKHLCPECGASFTQSHDLTIHIKRHRGETPFKCRYCDKAFPRIKEQLSHERTHTGEKNYQCGVCSKAFTRSNRLRDHLRSHTGEDSPYKCSQCPMAFTEKSSVKFHERIHTGEKNYRCTVCFKTFTRSNGLQIHMRIHTGERPYKCPHCPMDFTEKSSLNRHIKQHTGERHYCDLCDVGFCLMHKLIQHKRKVHGIDEPCGRSSLLDNREDQIPEE